MDDEIAALEAAERLAIPAEDADFDELLDRAGAQCRRGLMLPVAARPEVADDLARLTPALLRSIRGLLPRLREDALRHSQPLDYDPRIGNLGDCREVYFDEDETIRPAGFRIASRARLSDRAR